MAVLGNVLGFGAFGIAARAWQLGIQKRNLFQSTLAVSYLCFTIRELTPHSTWLLPPFGRCIWGNWVLACWGRGTPECIVD